MLAKVLRQVRPDLTPQLLAEIIAQMLALTSECKPLQRACAQQIVTYIHNILLWYYLNSVHYTEEKGTDEEIPVDTTTMTNRRKLKMLDKEEHKQVPQQNIYTCLQCGEKTIYQNAQVKVPHELQGSCLQKGCLARQMTEYCRAPPNQMLPFDEQLFYDLQKERPKKEAPMTEEEDTEQFVRTMLILDSVLRQEESDEEEEDEACMSTTQSETE